MGDRGSVIKGECFICQQVRKMSTTKHNILKIYIFVMKTLNKLTSLHAGQEGKMYNTGNECATMFKEKQDYYLYCKTHMPLCLLVIYIYEIIY